MTNDKFFSQTKCDRCGGNLSSRTMSWFTTETICIDKCAKEEREIKNHLPDGGKNYEGCGYLPKLETI
jgi:hypothetical protein